MEYQLNDLNKYENDVFQNKRKNNLLPSIRYNQKELMNSYEPKNLKGMINSKINKPYNTELKNEKYIPDEYYINRETFNNEFEQNSSEKIASKEIKKINSYNEDNYNNFNTEDKTAINNGNYTMRKYNSQINLFNNNYNINNNSNNEEDLTKFMGKIKIFNFFSSAEIILLIESILEELNIKKNYTFTIKDSLMIFSFNSANKALSVFKRLNIEKLNNKYYQNLIVDINLELKNDLGKGKNSDVTGEFKEGNKKSNYYKISPKVNISNNITNIKNIKTYDFRGNLKDLSDKNFEGIYKSYQDYFKKRKIQRRIKELNYTKGKNVSLQSCSPYVENDNRNFFVENLRKYKGENISPSTFNPYIDKASNKSRIYKIYNN